MHLRQLRLQNIACFEDVTLDFTDEKGEPCKWVVLLGENGTGKSTILQTCAVPLPVSSFWISRLLQMLGKSLLRVGASTHTIDLIIGTDPVDWLEYTGPLYHPHVEISQGGLTISSSAFDDPNQYIFNPEDILHGWFAAGYRPTRDRRRFADGISEPTSYALRSPKDDRFTSLFDDYSRLTSIREWLADLDYRQLKEKGVGKSRAEIALALAIQAIEIIFPGDNVKFKEITSTKDIIFEENGLRVSIDALSDGYRSAITWIGDLVRRLVEAFPEMENPLHAHGVVLVDEIDQHLHPRWQRTIVEQIRKIFPNLQFIVTTHSPFIAQDMTEKDKLIVLKREGDKVTATEGAGFVQGWRVDQILTSYLFGLSSTRGEDVANAERQRRDLLDQEAQGGLSPEQRETLDRVNATIQRFKSPPDEKPFTNGTSNTLDELNKAAEDILSLLAAQSAGKA